MPGPSITAKTSVEVAITRTQSEKKPVFFLNVRYEKDLEENFKWGRQVKCFIGL